MLLQQKRPEDGMKERKYNRDNDDDIATGPAQEK